MPRTQTGRGSDSGGNRVYLAASAALLVASLLFFSLAFWASPVFANFSGVSYGSSFTQDPNLQLTSAIIKSDPTYGYRLFVTVQSGYAIGTGQTSVYINDAYVYAAGVGPGYPPPLVIAVPCPSSSITSPNCWLGDTVYVVNTAENMRSNLVTVTAATTYSLDFEVNVWQGLELQGAAVAISGPTSQTTTTDQFGGAYFNNIPAGMYSYSVQDSGYVTATGSLTIPNSNTTANTLVPGGYTVTNVLVYLHPGTTIGTQIVNFVVQPTSAVPPATITVSGQVARTDTSAGVSGGTVDLEVDGAAIVHGTTDANGMFSMTFTVPGTYNQISLTTGGHAVVVFFEGLTVAGTQYASCFSSKVTVNVASTLSPQISVAPTTVQVGGTLTVTGSGFTPSSTATVLLSVGAGVTYPVATSMTGAFNLPISISQSLAGQYGQYAVSACDGTYTASSNGWVCSKPQGVSNIVVITIPLTQTTQTSITSTSTTPGTTTSIATTTLTSTTTSPLGTTTVTSTAITTSSSTVTASSVGGACLPFVPVCLPLPNFSLVQWVLIGLGSTCLAGSIICGIVFAFSAKQYTYPQKTR